MFLSSITSTRCNSDVCNKETFWPRFPKEISIFPFCFSPFRKSGVQTSLVVKVYILWTNMFCYFIGSCATRPSTWEKTRKEMTTVSSVSACKLRSFSSHVLPGLRSSLRLEGESMCSRASAASMVLSEQWTLVPWTEASTATQTQEESVKHYVC